MHSYQRAIAVALATFGASVLGMALQLVVPAQVLADSKGTVGAMVGLITLLLALVLGLLVYTAFTVYTTQQAEAQGLGPVVIELDVILEEYGPDAMRGRVGLREALDAALADPRQSFTILPYGCSGATITEGILYGYNGVEWSPQTDKGVVGSRSEIGLAYQEICRPEAFRSYCASGASWCGQTDPPTARQEQAPGFYDAAAPALRRAVARCGPNNVFKRSADALLIDIGINDVGFAGWAASIILQDPALRAAAGATAPCFDGTARCASTQSLFARLDRRYGLLRTVLDQYMLPDFGIDPSHVIVAVYPPALQDDEGAFCPEGNSGLTIAT